MAAPPIGFPVAHDGDGADTQHSDHLARAAVRGRRRLALRAVLHQIVHVHLDRRRPVEQVRFDALKDRLNVAPAAGGAGPNPADNLMGGERRGAAFNPLTLAG